jgi:muconate cycloisomerase
MADESACTLDDVKRLSEQGCYQMINVRLSKCGGFRRSLRTIDYLRDQGLDFQIACHLGESGILSAAGRALSLLCADAVYHDGSYDDILLKENITTQNISFGMEGEAGPLRGLGLGVTIDKEQLRHLSAGASAITINGV